MSDSAPVPVTTDAAPDFAAFEAAENAKALGQPDPIPAPAAPAIDAPPTDPLADEHDEPEAVAIEAAPVTPTPEKPVSKRQQHINELERKAKLAELRAEELAAKIAEIEARTPPAAEPAKPAVGEAVADPSDPEPIEAEIGTKFTTYAEFTRELARWVVRQERRAADAMAERQTVEQTARERISTWYERRDAFAAQQPDFAEKAGPFLERIRTGTPLYDVLTDSPVGPAIVWHLVTHPEVARRIAQLAPTQQLRALGTIEGLYDSSLTSTSASAGPAAKTVTTAPAPPTTLAARSADPADPVAAAVARGDFRAFEDAENRKAIAAYR